MEQIFHDLHILFKMIFLSVAAFEIETLELLLQNDYWKLKGRNDMWDQSSTYDIHSFHFSFIEKVVDDFKVG